MTEIIKKLSVYTGMHEVFLRRIISSAPERYKTYRIPKKNGAGFREISQPAREVKTLQRALYDILLKDLPVHQAATAYVAGSSIADNAAAHASNGPILKMDFQDFFPSIRRNDWLLYCEETGCLSSEDDLEITSLLLFHRPKGMKEKRLAIGAPTSPALSNILMFKFDEVLSKKICNDKLISYTRYADDLTFSAPRTGYLTGVQRYVYETISEIKYPRLQINKDKTKLITKRYRRIVTGLVLSNDGLVSLGRDRKRKIRSLIHSYSVRSFSAEEASRLSGLLAFAKAVEPDFLVSLVAKYGADLIEKIQRAPHISKPKSEYKFNRRSIFRRG